MRNYSPWIKVIYLCHYNYQHHLYHHDHHHHHHHHNHTCLYCYIDDFKKDILSSVQQYCGFVDANSLCFLWPTEFQRFRITFISGPLHQPIISCFYGLKRGGNGKDNLTKNDVLIRCNGDHFTLLRPCSIIPGVSVNMPTNM